MNYKKVLILGSSALKIGEAGEFDYSGSQAIKALKEEGISTILINPNIATIQTTGSLADRVYFLPVTPEFTEKIIEKEKPDGILLSFGGQTALNCGLELHKSGVLKKHNIAILGSPIEAVIKTEDRKLFNDALAEINVDFPKSRACTTVEDALDYAKETSYPVLVRIAYALGGLGSGICTNKKELQTKVKKALSYAPQILVEEYLEGWKEIEYEVVRDKDNNCVTICNMENMDPLGIHTGESIVVAPSQTLSNEEYHKLREIAIKVVQHFGIVGECNIQYALDPQTSQYRVIEVNARLSRSSALASKATGYPLAFIGAKLALGYSLYQLRNSITQTTSAFFEPALDYVVVKIPRWDLKKFRMVKQKIGSSMKSVGEVMAIGRSFEEALQKALRMLDTGAEGLVANSFRFDLMELLDTLKIPSDTRIFAIIQALQEEYSLEYINKLTFIDDWFLQKLKNVVDFEKQLKSKSLADLAKTDLLKYKQLGYSDKQIAILTKSTESEVYSLREKHSIHPYVHNIDTLAAEFPAQTNYLYLTYNSDADDIDLADENSTIILGSGPYRIGSSVEFDWCCVKAGLTVQELGKKSVMINCNPETVSTDYDESDVLFFEEITLETVREIYNKVTALGLIISMGGQTANNLALDFHREGLKVLGTSPEMIDRAEDRSKFSNMLDKIGVEQPAWKKLTTIEEALNFANYIGYPVLIRPSYVLSGAAMAVASNDNELLLFLQRAADLSSDHPTVISKFMENAKELEFDGVAQNGKIKYYAISEHVENAGVHSGDATLVLPPQRTYLETMRQIRRASEKIAAELNINGPFNIQYIAKDNKVKVIECNLRASRSFPFVSKTFKTNFIDKATRIIMGENVSGMELSLFDYDFVAVKAPEFSFTRLEGADPTTGVEMSSTGEVACFGNTFSEAFLKALISVGYKFPIKSVLISSGTIESKVELLDTCRKFLKLGVKFYATRGTGKFLNSNGIPAEVLRWPLEKGSPQVLDYLKTGKIDLAINIPKNFATDELTNDYMIRRTAVDYKVPLVTNRQLAMRLAESLYTTKLEDLAIKSWDEY